MNQSINGECERDPFSLYYIMLIFTYRHSFVQRPFLLIREEQLVEVGWI